MKIKKESIDLIKQTVKLSDLASFYIKVIPAGNRFKALCPFHNEKTPSFTISDEKGFFHCFGCKASGDLFSFVSKIDNISFSEAVLKTARLFNISVQYEHDSSEEQNYEGIKRAFALMTAHYAESLGKSPEGMAYIKKRKLSASTVQEFGIGFATRTDKTYIAGELLKKERLPVELLRDISIVSKREDDLYPFFYNRLMIPIRNSVGETIAFGGRVIDDGTPKYINSGEHALFKKGQMLYNYDRVLKNKDERSIIVVEGYFDVITAAQNGIGNIVAPLGTALTENHLRMLGKRFDTLYLLFDADEAGQKATVASLEVAVKHFANIRVINLPDGCKDIDEFFNRVGTEKNGTVAAEEISKEPAAEWKIILEKSGNGIDKLLMSKLYLKKAQRDLRKIYNAFFLYLKALQDEMLADMLLKKAAQFAGDFGYEDLKRFYGQSETPLIKGIPAQSNSVRPESTKVQGGHENRIEMEFAAFLVNHPEFISTAAEYIKPHHLVSEKGREFYKKVLLSQDYEDKDTFFGNSLTDRERELVFSSSYADTIEGKKGDGTGEELPEHVFKDFLTFFKLNDLDRQLKEINGKIRDCERAGDFPAELLERKQFIIASVQKLKEMRRARPESTRTEKE